MGKKVKGNSVMAADRGSNSVEHEGINGNESEPIFGRAINRYIQLIDTQDKSLPVITRVLVANLKTWSDDLIQFMDANDIKLPTEDNNHIRFDIPLELASKFQKLLSELNSSYESLMLAVSNIVVAIVSLYDAYFAELIRIYYKVNPAALDISNKQFSAEQVLQYDSISSFKEALAEKEIETILRDSHTDQIEWLEKKLGIPLTKDLPIYSSFVEITERRNLFVHSNGRVSKQYIKECKKYGVEDMDKIAEGETLVCTNEYAKKCYSVFYEMGVKLGIVMWHKLLPGEYEGLYQFVDSTCYGLIREGKYDLALSILDFILTSPFRKDCPHAHKLVFAINKSLVYQLKGKTKKAYDIVNKLDCSAAEEMYRMAVYILKGDKDSALKSMEKIGKDPDMRSAYREWPLFTTIRDMDEFAALYQRLYEEEYQYDEIPSADFEHLMRNAMEMSLSQRKDSSTPTERK